MARARLDVFDALARAHRCLLPSLDLIEGRVSGDAPPAWCVARGWSEFLLALDDAALARCEVSGLSSVLDASSDAPASLVALVRAARDAAEVPALRLEVAPICAAQGRSVPLRKQPQLEALLAAVRPLGAHARRIVDVGAGHGHFARRAAERFDTETLGLDRDEARVKTATSLSVGTPGARFLAFDASSEELSLGEGDLAIGLHACGALGDTLVLAAARGGADVALVSCCLQKIHAESRAPLSRAGAALTLSRGALGLTNVTARAQGVEASMGAIMEARRARHALHELLRSRGVCELPGAEMTGINRRQARLGLPTLAARALALRGLAPASDAELEACAATARVLHDRIRRWSLPRSALARVVEVALVLDRASFLGEAGYSVRVATVFDEAVSPRNLGIFASCTAARLDAYLD
jgi:SAM-dependent methyltransferase